LEAAVWCDNGFVCTLVNVTSSLYDSVLLFLVALFVFENITSEACKRGRGSVALSHVKFQRALQTEHVRRETVLISPVDFDASDTKSQVRPAFKWQA